MASAIGAGALAASLIFPPNIFWLTTFIATVFASSWGPVGLMSIWSKRITESAAFSNKRDVPTVNQYFGRQAMALEQR